tara:strand:- start:1914 stop:3206 length:1293 start_codon:yes stop_codon:yes gene_type:complete
LAQLQLWYKADDAATITESGGAVSQWADKSGNAYHLTQATGAKQPQTGVSTINTKNALHFDGSEWMKATNAIRHTSGAVFIVAEFDLINNANDGLFYINNTTDATGENLDFISNDTNNFDGNIDSKTNPLALTGGPFAGPAIFEITFDSGGSKLGFVNGTDKTSGGNAYTDLSINADFGIMSNLANTDSAEGNIAEIIVLDDAPTTQQRQWVEGYLACEWGLQSALPIGHPYKTNCPRYCVQNHPCTITPICARATGGTWQATLGITTPPWDNNVPSWSGSDDQTPTGAAAITSSLNVATGEITWTISHTPYGGTATTWDAAPSSLACPIGNIANPDWAAGAPTLSGDACTTTTTTTTTISPTTTTTVAPTTTTTISPTTTTTVAPTTTTTTSTTSSTSSSSTSSSSTSTTAGPTTTTSSTTSTTTTAAG